MRNSSVNVADPTPPASSCLDEGQERQMGAVITSDYISKKARKKEPNMKEMQFQRSTELSLVSSQKKNRGFCLKAGEIELRTKVYANHKIWSGFICHSNCVCAVFMMQIGKIHKSKGSQTTIYLWEKKEKNQRHRFEILQKS